MVVVAVPGQDFPSLLLYVVIVRDEREEHPRLLQALAAGLGALVSASPTAAIPPR